MSDEPLYHHTERYPKGGFHPAWEVIYWRGNKAATSDPEDKADHARLRCFSTGGYVEIATFKLPTEQRELETFLRGLRAAWEQGRAARSRELMNMLNGVGS